MSSRGVLGAIACSLALLSLLVTVSCEFPFSLRDSEQSTGTAVNIQLTTDPGLVRTNIWRCYLGREPGPYGDHLSDDFVFVTDPIDAAALEQAHGGDFSEWDGTVDKKLTEYLLDHARCTLVLCDATDSGDRECIPDSTVQEKTATLCTIQYSYKFIFVLNDDWKHVSGEARFFMRKDPRDDLWRIFRWEDIKPQSPQADTTTWGWLKGETLYATRGVAL
jgi:hypothetical protein